MNREILLVEDDESLNRAVTLKLTRAGYVVYPAVCVKAAEALIRIHSPALIICDIGLPDGSGLDFCIDTRTRSSAVFLFLTAMDAEADMIRGYEAGADDYITKPFSLTVLLSKVNAIMSRYAPGIQQPPARGIRSGPITLLFDEKRVLKGETCLKLTATEYRLLSYFMENPMKVLSSDRLLEAVWDAEGSFVDRNTVAVNIRRLREKIEEDPAHPVLIRNLRGLGYVWERECEKS